MTTPQSDIRKILYRLHNDGRLNGKEGAIDQQIHDVEVAEQAITAHYAAQVEQAFKHGLIVGAMPEALGRPIAEDYIKQLGILPKGESNE